MTIFRGVKGVLPAAKYSTVSLTCSNIFSISRLGSYAFFIVVLFSARSVGCFFIMKV